MTTARPRGALNLDHAAEYLDISKRALRRLVDSGEITARYPNSRPVIAVRELDAWLASAPTERPDR